MILNRRPYMKSVTPDHGTLRWEATVGDRVRFQVGDGPDDWLEVTLDPHRSGVVVRGLKEVKILPDVSNTIRIDIDERG